MTLILLILLGAVAFFIVISGLVFFHELGHYSVARLFGVAVERFSIGFGKPIWRHRAKSGTEWVFASIPLGGYVKFLGDAGAASNPDSEQLAKIKADLDEKHGAGVSDSVFHFKPLWQRVLVVLAGPIANFILAAVIFTGFFMAYGKNDLITEVAEIMDDTPAQRSGLEVGDRILKMDGKDIRLFSEFRQYVILRSDQEIEVTVLRGEQQLDLSLTPMRIDKKDAIGGRSQLGYVGVRPANRADLQISKDLNMLQASSEGVAQVGRMIVGTGTYIKRIFTGKESGRELGGIVRIAAMTGKTAADGASQDVPVKERAKDIFQQLIYLAAALSIGLGVANLMPIPVLDGGHLLFYGYEAVAGRPLSQDKQEFGFRIGFALILGLFVILTWNDIGYVRSLF